LTANGIPPAKVVVCRQGVNPATHHAMRDPQANRLRVGFVGRYEAVKGLHVLIDAEKLVPDDVGLEVHVWGIARRSATDDYRDRMISRARGRSRVIFHAEGTDRAAMYGQMDVLAVPSLWLETGPLVVLEAQAAGLPVVGSRLGGIVERVTDGRDGILVPPGDARALARVLRQLAREPEQVKALRYTGAVRTTADVARETLATYHALVSRTAA
jgi:glycosyltransferase involved in cell wall biosynthesis